MAAGRRRRWFAIGGATAAVAIGAWAAVALGAPTLTVLSTTHLPVNLSWTDSGGATAFDLTRRPGTCALPTGGPTQLTLSAPTALSFADSTAGDGHYCYSVTGTYDPADPTPDSADVWVDNTPPTLPAVSFSPPPSGSALRGTVTIIGSSSDPIVAGAGAPTGVTGYVISVDGGAPLPGGQWVTSGDGPHTVHVTAVDGALNQSLTNNIAVTVKNSQPVTAPNLRADPPVVAGRPTLTWDPVPGDFYYVTRTSSTGPGLRAFTDAAARPWTDNSVGLVPGTYTYTVTTIDASGASVTSGPVSVIVIPPSVTAPRAISANSPTNSPPHVTWQPPVTFEVTSWMIYRDGAQLQPIGDASVNSFVDTTASQGAHTYAVQALRGATPGDMSSPVSVTFDSVPPVLAPVKATASPNGSVAVNWPAADDPAPGSGVASYVVRRGASAPSDATGGTAICTLKPPDTGCVDDGAKSGSSFGYAVFAVDAAGNYARREDTARAIDTVSPDAVTNLKVVSFDRTYVRIGWTVPPLKGADADLAGYRVIMLRKGAKAPLSPTDGTSVCRNDEARDNICDALNLTTGQKVTFAVYAIDEVPNYAPPVLISAVPHSVDKTPPHKPTKVKLSRAGLTYTLKWVSPKDRDLSKFRITIYDKGPAPKPSKGKVVGQGRILHATFTLKPGKRTYINLFALDVTGNFSRVSKLIVAPGKAAVPKSKKKKPPASKTVKKPPVKKDVKKPVAAKTVKKPAQPEKPIPVTVAAKG